MTPRQKPLTLDHAILAVVLAAMDADRHVSAQEAARAHHLIWSMRRFRRRSSETVDELMNAVRARFDERGTDAVLSQAARVVPARLRAPVFAVAVEVMLADSRLDEAERRAADRLARTLRVRPALADQIIDVVLAKNGVKRDDPGGTTAS